MAQPKEVLYQIFDGQPKPGGGNRVAKYLQDNFRGVFAQELKKLKAEETVSTAFRRAFLSINKTITDIVTHSLPSHNGVQGGQGPNKRQPGSIPLDIEDLNKYGSSALAAYINGKTLTLANVGDTVAVLARTTGEVKVLSKKHRPGEASELERIRSNGGSLTRNGKISFGFSSLETSRAVGYVRYAPAVIAAPHIEEFELTDQDEVLILANNELWKWISYQTAVDVVRTERDDALRAAHKLRDFGMAYGATGRLCVMVIRVGDLFHKKVRQPWSRNASTHIMLRAVISLVMKTASSALLRRNVKERRAPGGFGRFLLIYSLTLDTCTVGERSSTACRGCCYGVHRYQELNNALGTAPCRNAFSNQNPQCHHAASATHNRRV